MSTKDFGVQAFDTERAALYVRMTEAVNLAGGAAELAEFYADHSPLTCHTAAAAAAAEARTHHQAAVEALPGLQAATTRAELAHAIGVVMASCHAAGESFLTTYSNT